MTKPFAMRAAVLDAGEEYCLDPAGDGMLVCTRPAGHTGKHAAHDDNEDVPFVVWTTNDRARTRGEGDK